MHELAGERLVGTEDEMERAREREWGFAFDQRQRRVGRQAQHRDVVVVADVVAAHRMLPKRLAVAAGRPHPDGDARQAGDRLDDAKELRRPKHAAELVEARREVGDADRVAVPVGQVRAHDRRVAQILGVDVDNVVEQHVGEALLLVAGEQARKERIAVEARKAPPDDPRRWIDQRGRAPVADEGEVETVVRHEATLSSTRAMRSSQARTLAGVAK